MICSDICFVPEVPGCPLLARGLSPLHVPDGTAPQNTEIQLPDRSTGLCGCPSREDPSGVSQAASVLHLVPLSLNESERAEILKSHSCLRKGSSGNNRGGWDIIPFVPYHSPDLLLSPSQCLNAVRTVQSLACLEEADHTVGFILQLSNFTKEWHFHLPQLMRDMQVGIRILLWLICCLGMQGFGCFKKKWHCVTLLLPLL